MSKYYLMTPKTCFLCKYDDGMAEDPTPNKPLFAKCDHKVDVGALDLQIFETELFLRDLKKARRYAKKITE